MSSVKTELKMEEQIRNMESLRNKISRRENKPGNSGKGRKAPEIVKGSVTKIIPWIRE